MYLRRKFGVYFYLYAGTLTTKSTLIYQLKNLLNFNIQLYPLKKLSLNFHNDEALVPNHVFPRFPGLSMCPILSLIEIEVD